VRVSVANEEAINEEQSERFASAFKLISDNIEQVVQGKRDVVEKTVLTLVAGGHLLIEDVPGVGKTTLAKALAHSVGATLGRIQFTPDLLPADVLGVSVWNRADSSFEFRPGPVFTGLVLADEINRASPKTQSALLEAMAERQVTVDGKSHRLPVPFMVMATQNPVDHEGTYPLPESQLDRFLLRISVGYPTREAELAILHTHQADGLIDELGAVVSVDDVVRMARMVQYVGIDADLRHYLVALAEATRRHPSITLGMSPRATLSLQRVARARAASQGRPFVTDDDIKAVAVEVVAHRLLLKPEAQLQGTSAERVVEEVLAAVPVPQDRR
jgi:MoxR-like ATPase